MSKYMDNKELFMGPKTTQYGSQKVMTDVVKPTKTKYINIDTRFRENYYTTLASNFHVNLPLKLSKVVSLQLSAIELPNTFYVISQIYGNNFFVLEIVDEEPLIVTIPDGNYDYIGLQNFINNFLSIQLTSYSTLQFLADVNTPNGMGSQSGSAKMVVGSTTGTTKFSINFLYAP